ncbi:MAG: hypothetical protein U0Q16_37200 [Bryobacteraceae bacterium]
MHPRRFATLLLGGWLAGAIFCGWVASNNLTGVDRMMREASLQARKEFNEIGLERTRRVFRFQAAELNRHYFNNWELVQMLLGVGLGITLLFATNGNKLVMALCTAMFLIVVVQHFTITPQMIDLGRGLDFDGGNTQSAERQSFRGMHELYSYLEVVKVLIGVGLAVRLLFFKPPSSGRRRRSRRSESSGAEQELSSTPPQPSRESESRV